MTPVSGHCKDAPFLDSWHDEVVSATNLDGSAVKLVIRHYPKKDLRKIEVFFRADPDDDMVSIGHFEQTLRTAPLVGAQIVDWNKDGEHEIEINDFFGAGPNCESTIYRVDKKKHALSQFFRATGSNVELIDGYLVQSGRDSCCSWIYDAHKFVSSRQWVNPKASFSVFVESGDAYGNAVTCTFYIDGPLGRQTINPPSKAFLKFCDGYGHGYVVTHPSTKLLQK